MPEKYTVTIDFYDDPNIASLKTHFEKLNEMRKQAGEEPYTFEAYLKDLLLLGCYRFMKTNAEHYEKAAIAFYKPKKHDE